MEEHLDLLRRNQRRLQALVRAVSSLTWVATTDGSIVGDLPLWRDLTGQTPDEIADNGWMAVIHPEDRPHVRRTWMEAVRTASLYAAEYRVARPDGGWAWLESYGGPVLDDDGRVLEFIGLCIDVTERRELAAALEQDRRLLERVVAVSPVGIGVLWGPDLRVLLVNDVVRRLVPDDRPLLGRRFDEVAPALAAELRPLLRRGPDGVVGLPEQVVEVEEGGRRHFALRVQRLPGEGEGADGLLLLAVERTEEVRRQEELEARLRAEQEVARTLQDAIAVDPLPEPPGFALAGRYAPGAEGLDVGGDWYDALVLDDDRLALLIGDAAGRGLPAATVMGQARAVLRAAMLQPGATPAGALAVLDRFVAALPDSPILTAAVAVLDRAAGRLTFAKGGHPPALLQAAGEVRAFREPSAPPLGTPGFRTHDVEAELPAGATLLLFTDGLIERPDRSLEEGLDAVAACLRSGEGAPLEALADEVLASRARGERDVDDAALVVARLRASS